MNNWTKCFRIVGENLNIRKRFLTKEEAHRWAKEFLSKDEKYELKEDYQ